jgi:hypothetical protein
MLLLGLLPSAPVIEPGPVIGPVLLPASSAAPDEFPALSYTYFEGNYVWLDNDASGSTFDGIELVGSFQLPVTGIFLQAGVRKQSSGADLTTWTLSAGYHIGFGGRFDAYGLLSWQDVKLDGSASDFTDSGIAGEAGLRMMMLKNLELNGRFKWADIDNSDAGGGVGARFYFARNLSGGLNIDRLGSDNLLSAGVRFGF